LESGILKLEVETTSFSECVWMFVYRRFYDEFLD